MTSADPCQHEDAQDMDNLRRAIRAAADRRDHTEHEVIWDVIEYLDTGGATT